MQRWARKLRSEGQLLRQPPLQPWANWLLPLHLKWVPCFTPAGWEKPEQLSEGVANAHRLRVLSK